MFLYLIPIPFIYQCKHEFINRCERKKNRKQVNEIIAIPLQNVKGINVKLYTKSKRYHVF